MPDNTLKEIADHADIIVAGYAYTVIDGHIRVLNLENENSAAVLDCGWNTHRAGRITERGSNLSDGKC